MDKASRTIIFILVLMLAVELYDVFIKRRNE